MRPNTLRTKLWLCVGVTAVAAVAATGAAGVPGAGTITTIAGTGKPGFSGDGGPATSAQLRSANGLAVDKQGNVYIADFDDHRVRRVGLDGTITTFAGKGGGGGVTGDGGPATSARLDGPRSIAIDAQGNVYIADATGHRVRMVSPNGTITTIAGTGQATFSGDGGPATAAGLYGPTGVAVDAQRNVYVVDSYNHRVRKVSADGTIATVAGTGKQGFSGDGGPATAAQLGYPTGVAVDGQGNVYIAEPNNRVRKVSVGGTITTFAGTGAGGFSGDGGLASSALLRPPEGLAVDAKGNVYIADYFNHRVRMVNPNGTITTFAGTGTGGFSGDGGPSTSSQLYGPAGLAVDRQGNVYVGDKQNYRVRKVTVGATTAAVKLTLAGAATQRLLAQKSVIVTARCDKPCALAATGTVSVIGTPNVFKLTGMNASLGGAGSSKLTLRLPPAAQQQLRRLLTPGQKSRAVITVRATGDAGSTTTAKRTVAVRS